MVDWELSLTNWRKKFVVARMIRGWSVYPAAGNPWFDEDHQSAVREVVLAWDELLAGLSPPAARELFCTSPYGLAASDEDLPQLDRMLTSYVQLANLVAQEEIDRLLESLVAGTQRESKDALEKLQRLLKQVEAGRFRPENNDRSSTAQTSPTESPSAAASDA